MDLGRRVVFGRIATLAGPSGTRKRAELGRVELIEDGALAVEFGRIAWIGPRNELPSGWRSASTMGDKERLMTPGLIDAHTHLVFGGNRVGEFADRAAGKTYEQIAEAGGGIRSTVQATRGATDDELVEAGLKHANWLLSNGTTTAEAKSGYGLSMDEELRILNAVRAVSAQSPIDLVPTLLAAHALPPEGGSPAEYVAMITDELLPQVAEKGLAEYVDAFIESGFFDVKLCEPMLERAATLGLGIRLHVDQLTPGGGAQFAARVGAVTADHLEQTEADGIEALAAAGVQPVLLPASVFALGKKRYPDAKAMIEAGLGIVLATDFNPGSSPVCSLPFVMSLACTQMGMTPSEALVACTINAACSLNRGADRGSLEAGKRADFVLWDCEDPRELAYWIGAPLVHQVWVEGKLAFSAIES